MSNIGEAGRMIEEMLGIAPSTEGSEAGRLIQEIVDEQHARYAEADAEARNANPFYDLQATAIQQLVAEFATHGEYALQDQDYYSEIPVPISKITGVREEDAQLWSDLEGRPLPGDAKLTVCLMKKINKRNDSRLDAVSLTVDTWDWVPPLPEVWEGA